ncbi:hypothetical protein H312_01073 [Anncaliia algerae PRA339]|uniref:Uncharacterized protein n=1 Tax=Anncaliia algerae PRA339 TaxID=1288291 RepID=A0A059F2S6_9MICR|nr:hypothetical protein H312_01073 [Anncaliia algerae PRA339]
MSLFIKKTPELLKHISILKKISSTIEITPCTLKTSTIQIELSPFTNASITIYTSDLDNLLSLDTFTIEDNIIQYYNTLNIHNTALIVNKSIKLLNTKFNTIKLSNPNESFKSSYLFMSKIFKESNVTFKISKDKLKIFNDEIELNINDIKSTTDNEYEFNLKCKDIVFLGYYERDEVTVELYDSCVIFCIYFDDSTLLSRVPIIMK